MSKGQKINIAAAAIAVVTLIVLFVIPIVEMFGIKVMYSDVDGSGLVIASFIIFIGLAVFGILKLNVPEKVKKLVLGIGYVALGALICITTAIDFFDYLKEAEFSFVLLMPVIGSAAIAGIGAKVLLTKE